MATLLLSMYGSQGPGNELCLWSTITTLLTALSLSVLTALSLSVLTALSLSCYSAQL